jgi:hypothetical protein
MTPTDELIRRIAKLERDARRSRRSLRILIAGLCITAIGAGAKFANDNDRIDLKDDAGRVGISIGNFIAGDSARDIIVRDLNGRNRIAIGIDNNGNAYINVFGKDGQLVKNLALASNEGSPPEAKIGGFWGAVPPDHIAFEIDPTPGALGIGPAHHSSQEHHR